MELGDPFMMHKQLRNLKRRAELLATTRRSPIAGAAAGVGLLNPVIAAAAG